MKDASAITGPRDGCYYPFPDRECKEKSLSESPQIGHAHLTGTNPEPSGEAIVALVRSIGIRPFTAVTKSAPYQAVAGKRRPGGRPWTAKELQLLGTVTDGELAARTDRTAGAVRVMRTRLGIPNAADRRRREHREKTRRCD
jgi:hypothetical protein